MSILVGIDGTSGEFFPDSGHDQRYDDEFANSFVRKLCDETPGPTKKYLRGPLALGRGQVQAADEGLNFILARRGADVNEPILLTGYSRGAATVIFIATRLQEEKIDVKAMLFFDCVDRFSVPNSRPTLGNENIDARRIPNNVGNVLHVMRPPESGSREQFKNSGRQSSPPTRYKEAFFTCTHGAMGGTPWPVPAGQLPTDFIKEGFTFFGGKTNVTYFQDAWMASRVWSYVGPFIREHGFPIPLRPWCAPSYPGMGPFCSSV
jgi:hypothetical protein